MAPCLITPALTVVLAVTKHDGGAHILDVFASFVCDGKLCNPVHLKLCNISPHLPQDVD